MLCRGIWILEEKEKPELAFLASTGAILPQGEIPEAGTSQNRAGQQEAM